MLASTTTVFDTTRKDTNDSLTNIMPSFLTRIRAPRRPKDISTPANNTFETERNEGRLPPISLDASLDSPGQNVELDSKIYPDLSALFVSVEDELKSVGRPAKAQQQTRVYDDTAAEWISRYSYGEERMGEVSGMRSVDNGAYSGAGWTTFGRDANTDLKEIERSRTLNRDGVTSAKYMPDANFRPSSAEAVLSWSPKPDNSPFESPRPSGSSYHASNPSPEVRQSLEQTVYYSPSPKTFGYPSPQQFTPTGSPAFSLPVFQSTPKIVASPLQSMHKPSQDTSRFRFSVSGLSPLSSTFGKIRRAQSDRPKASKIFSRNSVDEVAVPQPQVPSRQSTNTSREPSRRQSAEWNARAASTGVNVDGAQTTEFGWPAEVSREILRLSLGEHAMAHTQAQGAPSTAMRRTATATDPANAVAKSRNREDLKRDPPRVSHEQQDNAKPTVRLVKSSNSEQRPSSTHLYSTTLPPSSSSSAALGRNGELRSFATQLASTPRASTVTSRKAMKSRSHSFDTAPGAEVGETEGAGYRRSGSRNKVEWDSAELHGFLSSEGSGRELARNTLRPSTPIKQSSSASTYETAGSSSFLHAPSLSVIAPTPRGSPGRSRTDSGVEGGNGLQVPTPPPQSDKSKGKRKADESEEVTPPDLRGAKAKKTTFAAEGKRSQRNSTASHAPSSFQSHKSRKRVRLSSPMATPDNSRPGSAVPPNLDSVSSRGSSRSVVSNSHFKQPTNKSSPPRPQSRASRASRAMSGASSGKGTVPFPKRRSLSQSSIPISAILSPRAPSLDRLSSFHMRDPQKPPPKRDIGWSLRLSSRDEKGSPFMAWAFWFGFLFPLLWWIASFWRIPKTRMVGTDTEKAVIVDDPFFEREARSWRLRCRIASGLFLITYVPVIVLLAIFVPRS